MKNLPIALGRGWEMAGIGFGISLLAGLGITRFYDRKGLHRTGVHRKEPALVPVD